MVLKCLKLGAPQQRRYLVLGISAVSRLKEHQIIPSSHSIFYFTDALTNLLSLKVHIDRIKDKGTQFLKLLSWNSSLFCHMWLSSCYICKKLLQHYIMQDGFHAFHRKCFTNICQLYIIKDLHTRTKCNFQYQFVATLASTSSFQFHLFMSPF